MLLTGEKVYLRSVEEADLATLVAWRNTPEIWAQFYNKFPLSLSGQKAWFDNLNASERRKLFLVCLQGQDSPVGTIGLDNIDFANQCVEIGSVLVAEKAALGKGVAQEAMRLMCDFCFNHLNMNRIYLSVFANNSRAVKLYEKCGFSREGVMREAHFSNGSFVDSLMMSLLRRDFGQTADS